jgi:hypothetical protein
MGSGVGHEFERVMEGSFPEENVGRSDLPLADGR